MSWEREQEEVESDRIKFPFFSLPHYHKCFFFSHSRTCTIVSTLIYTALTLVKGHAILFPGASLIYPAGVSVCPVIWHRHPREAADVGGHQCDIGTTSGLYGRNEVHWVVGIRGAHQASILFELAERPRDLVAFRELTIHTHIPLQVGEAGEYLRATGCVIPPGVKIQKAWFLVARWCSSQSDHTWQKHCNIKQTWYS